MMLDQDQALQARVDLGLFLRGFREDYFKRKCPKDKKKLLEQLSRRGLAGRAGTTEQVIINLEHGIVNPERAIFEKVIKSLELSDDDAREAFELLDLFSTSPSPHKWNRRGYRAPFKRLQNKRQRWQVRR